MVENEQASQRQIMHFYFLLFSLLKLLSFGTTMVSEETHSLGLPDFPLDNLHAVIQILVCCSSVSYQYQLHQRHVSSCNALHLPEVILQILSIGLCEEAVTL
jgi:hypothetical protein